MRLGWALAACLLGAGLPAAVPAADIGGWVAQQQGERAALERLRAEAEAGDAEAQYRLAAAYLRQPGEGSAATAAGWLRRAAEAGHGPAQFRLAQAYGTGSGVARNPVEAWAWHDLAAAQGVAGAAAARDALAAALSPEQVAAAQVLAASRRPAR